MSKTENELRRLRDEFEAKVAEHHAAYLIVIGIPGTDQTLRSTLSGVIESQALRLMMLQQVLGLLGYGREAIMVACYEAEAARMRELKKIIEGN